MLLLALISPFILGIVNAQANFVTGSISASSPEIIVHGSVTITSTYTSSLGVQGTGKLLMSGPAADPSSPSAWDDWTTLQYWDNTVGPKHSPALTSGVPVTFPKTLDTTGYYKFQWQCSGGGVDGAWTEVIVHVVDTPTVLPEASPLAVFALSFAAIGLFVVVTKKRTKQQVSYQF